MVTKDTWRDRMSEDMRLRDLRPRTVEGYLAATRQFIEWLGRGPETVVEDDIRNYFLYLREDKKLAPTSSAVMMYALRFSCNTFLRQTFVEWAAQSIAKSFWAKAFYDRARQHGASRNSALRALAFKWIRILFRCWQDRRPYDESHYLEALKKRQAPLLKFATGAQVEFHCQTTSGCGLALVFASLGKPSSARRRQIAISLDGQVLVCEVT